MNSMKLLMLVSAILCFGCVKEKWTCDDLIDNGGCQSGAYCTDTPSGNCSTGVTLPETSEHLSNTIYCCFGGSTGGGSSGGGGCTPTGCPIDMPWLCGAHCYADPDQAGVNHNCIACP
jgi:hypothetical protein